MSVANPAGPVSVPDSVADATRTNDLDLDELYQLRLAIEAGLSYSPIGGGHAWRETDAGADAPTREDATVIVEDTADFRDHAPDEDAVLWLPGDARIEVSKTTDVRATVASDRGVDGSEGALIYTDEMGNYTHAFTGGKGTGILQIHGDAYLTGFRLRGPGHDLWPAAAHPGYVPLRPDEGYSHYRARAGLIHGDDVVIENLEVFGWPQDAFHMGARGWSSSPTFRAIHGHDNMLTSAGYTLNISRGHPIIEDSYFNAERHSIAAFGYHDCGYTLRNSVIGPSASSHPCDMHGLKNNLSDSVTSDDPDDPEWKYRAGGEVIVDGVTFCLTHVIPDANFDEGLWTWGVQIRGVPYKRVSVTNCQFAHPGPTDNPGADGVRDRSPPAAVTQGPIPGDMRDETGFCNVELADNVYDAGLLPASHDTAGASVALRAGIGEGVSDPTPTPSPPTDPESDPETPVVSDGRDSARRRARLDGYDTTMTTQITLLRIVRGLLDAPGTDTNTDTDDGPLADDAEESP